MQQVRLPLSQLKISLKHFLVEIEQAGEESDFVQELKMSEKMFSDIDKSQRDYDVADNVFDFLRQSGYIKNYSISQNNGEWSAVLVEPHYPKISDALPILLGKDGDNFMQNDLMAFLNKREKGQAKRKKEETLAIIFNVEFEDIQIDTKNLVFRVNKKKVDTTGNTRDKTKKGLVTLWCMIEKQENGQGFNSRDGLGRAVFDKLKQSGLLEKVRKPKSFITYATDSISFARKILKIHKSVCGIRREELKISVSKAVKD